MAVTDAPKWGEVNWENLGYFLALEDIGILRNLQNPRNWWNIAEFAEFVLLKNTQIGRIV